jgi:hypothetical protein
MNKTLRRSSITAAALACTLGASAPANAVFVARICNDLMCTGGDDIIVQDNAAGDTIAASGAISFSVAAFGYTLLVNTSQSKPMLGSATSPQLDLTFSATSTGSANPIFLYASDTDFLLASGTFTLSVGGTNSGASGSDQGRAWGGTSNTEFQFSGANLLASLGPLTTSAFAASAGGTFAPTTDPYSLTIGTTISRTTAGTSTGDLNLQILAVPEPSTWALVLMGPALIAFVTRRRSRR